MMNKKYILAVITLVFAGCTWENPDYKKYVTEDGRVYFCPPKIEGEGENRVVKFETLDCTKDEKKLKQFKGNTPAVKVLEECLEANNSCKLTSDCKFCEYYRLDYLSCTEFQNKGLFGNEIEFGNEISFVGKYDESSTIGRKDVCPSKFPFCTLNDDRQFGCAESIGCRCSKESIENSENVGCNDKGECGVFSCKEGFHPDSEFKKCIDDDENSCNGLNCTQMAGWKTGKCIDGKCQAESCVKPGFHLFYDEYAGFTRCEMDDANNCGEHEHKCEKLSGASEPYCEVSSNGAQCGIKKCADYYHWDKNQVYCLKDTETECGSYNYNCTQLAGWKKGQCVNDNGNAKCAVETCKDDMYYLGKIDNENKCMPNTDENCGNSGNCLKEKKFCVNGECVDSCDFFNLTACEGKTPKCRDLSEPTSCGNCNNDCTKNQDEHVLEYKCDSSCKDGFCCVPKTCETGYYLNSDERRCLKYDEYNCGEFGRNCREINNNYICNDSGECVPECIDGYGDCDNNPGNGCEVELGKYGLLSCEECSSGYTGCGTHIIDGTNSKIALCLKQGGYYKNWEIADVKCSDYNSYLNWAWYSSKYGYDGCRYVYSKRYLFDYNRDDKKTVNYGGVLRSFIQINNTWNSDFLEWNETNCMDMCNNGSGQSQNKHDVGPNYVNSSKQTWPHKCEPTEICHQLDAFRGDKKEFYFDYGCK